MTTDTTPEPMAYAARYPGKPGFGAVMVDLPQLRADTAKTLAEWINDGAAVERVTIQQARDGLGEYLEARRPEPTQGALL